MHKPTPASAVLTGSRLPNRWDILLLPLVFGVLFLLAWGAHRMVELYRFGAPLPISLDPALLPEYALRTTLRMSIALLCSLLFTFVYAKVAVSSRRAEQILIPLLDILQSVPILGFCQSPCFGSFTCSPVACWEWSAAIFAIFTSQTWNMAFPFLYSLRMLPKDLYQVANLFNCRPGGGSGNWKCPTPCRGWSGTS